VHFGLQTLPRRKIDSLTFLHLLFMPAMLARMLPLLALTLLPVLTGCCCLPPPCTLLSAMLTYGAASAFLRDLSPVMLTYVAASASADHLP
jgi:hypothetical protein